MSFLSTPTPRAEKLRAFLKRATVLSFLRHGHRIPTRDQPHKIVYDAVVNHNFVLHKIRDPNEETSARLVRAQHACYKAFMDLHGSLSVSARVSEVPPSVTAAFADAILALLKAHHDYSVPRLPFERSDALSGLIISHMRLKRLTSNVTKTQNVIDAKRDIAEREREYKRLWGHKEFKKLLVAIDESCKHFVYNSGRPLPLIDITMFTCLSAPVRGDLYQATQMAISPGYFCLPWDIPEKTEKGMTLYFNSVTVFYITITKKIPDQNYQTFFSQLARLRRSLMLDKNQQMVDEVHRVFDIDNKFRRMCTGAMAWPEMVAYLTSIFMHVFSRHLKDRREVVNHNWERVRTKFHLETDEENHKSAIAVAMTVIHFSIDLLLEDEKEARRVFVDTF